MKKIKITAALMVAVMLLSLAGCGVTPAAKEQRTEDARESSAGIVLQAAAQKAQGTPSENYEWNKSKTYVVAVVTETCEPDGWFADGIGAEGFDKWGQKSWGFECEVLHYYNYSRLREIAENYDPDALYQYFQVGHISRWLSKNKIEDARTRGKVFTGDDPENYREYYPHLFETDRYLRDLRYLFHIDWLYSDQLQVGDVILFAVDPQLSIDPNSNTEKWFSAMVAPFRSDSPRPFLAKFADGKLQLDPEIAEAFRLYRIYDEPGIESRSIKDGDTVEDVIEFLKQIEQDMKLYEQGQTELS